MTSNFDARNDSKPPHSEDLFLGGVVDGQPVGALDSLKRDRFEMLSAYLDGEVTADERRQVESWLQNDPVVQRLYTRLLKLRQGMRSLPIPVPERSAEQTAKQVFSRVDRRPKLALAWAGVAVAAAFVGVFSNTLTGGHQSSAPQVADFPDPGVSTTALMIAVDRPILEIPKAPVSTPAMTVEQGIYELQEPIR